MFDVPNSISSPAIEHAECPICFEALYKEPKAGLFASKNSFLKGKTQFRVCQHLFHARCLTAVINKTCPLCRKPYEQAKVLPNPFANPTEWFSMVDVNGDGKLSKNEVIEVLKAELAIDWKELENALVPELWAQWDRNRDGSIGYNELMDLENGLMAFVAEHFPLRDVPVVNPPDIRDDKAGWFVFWDEDHSGCLQQEEVVRGLIKTFGLSENLSTVLQLRESVAAIWVIFDNDHSGSIELNEFLLPNGFADTICASLEFGL